MIRVGFLIRSTNWMGGFNYMNNLLYAIHSLDSRVVEPVVFMPKGVNKEIKEGFSRYAQVIEVSFLKSGSISGFVWNRLKTITQSDFIIELYVRKYKINVFSHSGLVGLKTVKTINWIPDFQFLQLPEMFQKEELNFRNKNYGLWQKKSDCILLSSYDALKDYRQFTKGESPKAKVLQFVSQPGKFKKCTEDEIRIIKEKYNITGDFFFIPNQFWKHKNHLIVFKALNLLKDRGHNITLVCTGKLEDYRNTGHINLIKEYIADTKIHVILLGLIDYSDLLVLMKYSLAVINPSFFEGWSSSVEECKSLGKNMILSDIAVHKEQNPANSFYFDPNNADELAAILLNHILNKERLMKLNNELDFDNDIKNRTLNFALNYQEIVKELV